MTDKEFSELISSEPEYNFVGYGTVKFSSIKIPHSHFLFNKTEYGYEAICLEYGVVSHTCSPKAAVEKLSDLLIEFVTANSMKTLSALASASIRNLQDLWAAYKEIQFSIPDRQSKFRNKNVLRSSYSSPTISLTVSPQASHSRTRYS